MIILDVGSAFASIVFYVLLPLKSILCPLRLFYIGSYLTGGGKTTQVKVLSGDLQPTAGEVVKSSKDLRVAFLRQEFVDELVMHRSLKEELTSVFKEESEILNELQACEVRFVL